MERAGNRLQDPTPTIKLTRQSTRLLLNGGSSLTMDRLFEVLYRIFMEALDEMQDFAQKKAYTLSII